MAKVLIIDDDEELAQLFAVYLERDGFSVDSVHEGMPGIDLALTGDYSLIVLDIMLPDIKGTEILARIRRESSIPVLMFTAKGDDIDRIIGLELGADDYVPKPCNPRELAARIRAIIRRTETVGFDKNADEVAIDTGALQIWSQQRKVVWRGKPLDLTSTEFNILQILAENIGFPVSKKELSEKGLGKPLGRFDRGIDVHISSIRQKLGQNPDGASYIQTIHGKGYQFLKSKA
jgi:two-component system, OmpR family, response regulator